MNAGLLSGAAAAGVLVASIRPRRWVLRQPVADRRRHRPIPRRRPATAAIGIAVVAVAAVGGPLVLAAAVAGALFTKGWVARRATQRRAQTIRQRYPDAIDLVVLALRAGSLPTSALAAAAPHLPADLRSAFDEVTARTARGARFADAIAALPEQLGPIALPMSDALAAADRYGLPLAPVLERLADEARAQRRRAAEAAARQLPVRLAGPLVLCTLPSFVLLAIVPLLIGAFSSWHLP